MRRVTGTGGNLTDVVFSWSLDNVLDENFYKRQVEKIPMEFLSKPVYMTSFIPALLEEIRADLLSSMKTVFEDPASDPPVREVQFVEESTRYDPPKNLLYNISLKGERVAENDAVTYKPENGDIIALTDTRPNSIDDSKRSERSYLIAFIQGSRKDSDEFQIVSSKPIEFEQNMQEDGKRNTLYAVFLINLTTNICIWNSLTQGLQGGSMAIIEKVLRPNSYAGGRCKICSSGSVSDSVARINSFKLNRSQKAAVLSCLATANCHHQNSVELIKGPPGTGKTNTVGSLLCALLGMKCRTLACAPTNIAVLEVAARVLSLVEESLEYDAYGLGDIVLFGSSEGMNIDDDSDLHDVFLDTRARILVRCFARHSGWKHCLESMINLLEGTKEDCILYMEDRTNKDNNRHKEKKHEKGILEDEKLEICKEREEVQYFEDPKSKKIWKMVGGQTSKGKKNKERQPKVPSPETNKLLYGAKEDKGELTQNKNNRVATGGHHDFLMSEKFVERFDFVGEQLKLFTEALYTHLPTSFISLEVVKDMVRALDLLEHLKEVLHECEDVGKCADLLPELYSTREECLQSLKCLCKKITLPNFYTDDKIKKFCLEKACLLFCTASSSVKLKMKGMTPVELLVIDEAAQLKECESTIPLQISGLRHAILVGDEMQLPALVKSKISEKAGFGRSLFERLVLLKHEYHLLNIQYRMHPSISSFPNKEFYENQISDAPNVKDRSYEKQFLQGSMYGPYSFVNVAYGKEEFENHSSRNMVEVAVVSEVVTSLFKESVSKKQKVSVGVISPYKAQVIAIQEKLGKIYNTDEESDFSVKVCTVDGFQGGEEDVIIISTVRGNEKGLVGFLSKRQRANVSLTRARHCLWIFGESKTLVESGTVWKRVVEDAKERGCFYNASAEKNLAQAMAISLVEQGQLDDLHDIASLLFGKARWKVFFSDEFWESMVSIFNTEVHKEVVSLLEKLSRGWRLKDRNFYTIHGNLLVQYNVIGQFNLLWSVDILEDDSYCIQILKVCDIVSFRETSRAVKQLCSLFENYTDDRIQRCKFKRLEGKLEVPMIWPINHDGCSVEVSNSFASLSLDDQLEEYAYN